MDKLNELQRDAVFRMWEDERLLPDNWREYSKYTWENLQRMEYILRRYPLRELFTSGSSVNGLVSLLVLGGVYLALKRR